MMLERVEQRAAASAKRAVERVRGRVVRRVADGLPDLTVAEEECGVVLTGRGLVRRLFSDARLRWIGALIR